MQTAIVGADIGGTFTDIVCLAADGQILIGKRLSTRDDYSRAVVEGIRNLLTTRNGQAPSVEEVHHGTTVATNAILERKGARTALVTTQGFRDRLEIGRLRIPRLYDIRWSKPEPLASRELRLEIGERVAGDGSLLRAPDDGAIAALAAHLRASSVESVAICFMNSYLNDANERAVRDGLAERLPELALSHSTELLREISEYERTSTTVVNAYIKPVMTAYLERLQAGLEQSSISARVYIMQSNGGVLPLRAAAQKPVYAIESGPAAGVIGAKALADFAGQPNVLVFDMGGTTAKASLIEAGEISYSNELEVGGELSQNSRLIKGGGYLIRTPTIDIAEVGAGGGSIAWLDSGGQLRIGPQSAGAQPGPACYGLGGSEPTVTDANLVLGYLNPTALAGGTVEVSLALARQAIATSLATPLGVALADAALGVHQLANASMGAAIRSVSTERGRDIREFALMAFGGSGAVHAATLARDFGISHVIIPLRPGVFSAVGLLLADIEQHFVVTPPLNASLLDRSIFRRLADLEAEREIQGSAGALADRDTRLDWFADLRYLHQGHTLRIKVDAGHADVGPLAEAFEVEHERQFGYRADGIPIEVVNMRIVVRGRHRGRDDLLRRLFSAPPTSLTAARAPARTCYFGPQYGLLETPVLNGRGALSEAPATGPLIVDEYDTSIVVPPDFSARRDGHGLVWLTNLNGGEPSWTH